MVVGAYSYREAYNSDNSIRWATWSGRWRRGFWTDLRFTTSSWEGSFSGEVATINSLLNFKFHYFMIHGNIKQCSFVRSWLRVYLLRSHSLHTLVYYRDALDQQRNDQVIKIYYFYYLSINYTYYWAYWFLLQMTWQPYTTAKMDALPHICRSVHEIWRSHCSLVCFDIVELHLPDSVMRQFGLEQVIPRACDTQPQLHVINRRTGDKNYVIRHRSQIDAWNDWASWLV